MSDTPPGTSLLAVIDENMSDTTSRPARDDAHDPDPRTTHVKELNDILGWRRTHYLPERRSKPIPAKPVPVATTLRPPFASDAETELRWPVERLRAHAILQPLGRLAYFLLAAYLIVIGAYIGIFAVALAVDFSTFWLLVSCLVWLGYTLRHWLINAAAEGIGNLLAIPFNLQRRLSSRIAPALSGDRSPRLLPFAFRCLFTVFAFAIAFLLWKPLVAWKPGAGVPEPGDFLLSYAAHCSLAIPVGLTFTALACGWAAVAGLCSDPGRGIRVIESDNTHEPTPFDLTIAHVTDLHLTSAEEIERAEGGPGGNRALRDLFARHKQTLDQAHILLATGDVTDGGNAGEWEFFYETLTDDIRRKTILVPGNHDVNIIDTRHRLAREQTGAPARALRLIRMLAAIDSCQGARARIVTDSGQFLSLRAYLEYHADRLEQFRSAPIAPTAARELAWLIKTQGECANEIEMIFARCFPHVVEVSPGCAVVVLNSTWRSTHIASNAFGRLSRRQLTSLQTMLRQVHHESLIIALHHHVALPHISLTQLWSAIQARFMLLENAGDLTSALRGRPCAVFHGHHHWSYEGRADNMAIISGASTTLGDEKSLSEKRPGFCVYHMPPTLNPHQMLLRHWFR